MVKEENSRKRGSRTTNGLDANAENPTSTKGSQSALKTSGGAKTLPNTSPDSVANSSSLHNYNNSSSRHPPRPSSMEGKTSNHNGTNSASASPSLSALLNNPPSPTHHKSSSQSRVGGRSTPPPQRHPTPPQPKAVEIIKSGAPGGAKARSAATSAAPSNASSPKPMRPVGNGLLGGAFGDSVLEDDGGEQEVPTIILHIPINGETNKYVNFTKLAEEQYGWAALNPRLARARERLGRDSGDEMMLDASESESAMEERFGAANDSAAATAAPPAKRKRRKIEETYDSGDPFIDDSEMAWEEQAAASKDGFFVYSGPLVPEGEKPQIERADGTVKRSRGGARSGRGGSKTGAGKPSAPRKPRLTKVAKEKMNREKEEREKLLKSSVL